MLFVWSLLISIGCGAVILGWGLVFRLLKKKPLDVKANLLNLGIDAGVAYLLSLIILSFVYGLFERHSDWNVALGLIASALVVFALRPHRLVLSLLHKESGAIKKHKPLLVQIGLLFVCLLSETLICNAANYGGPKGAKNEYTSATYSRHIGSEREDGTIDIGSGRYVILPSMSFSDIENIYIDTDYQNCEMTVSIGYKNGSDYTTIASKTVNPAYEYDRSIAFKAPSGVEEGILRIVLFFPNNRAGYPTSIRLRAVRTNVGNLFSFSLLRFMAMVVLTEGFAIILFHRKPDSVEPETKESVTKKFVIRVSIFAGMAMAAFLILAFAMKDYFFTTYPFTSEELGTNLTTAGSTNPFIYYNLFDAFMKGQVHLDVEADPLLATINPYSPAERRAAGVTYLWDTVYYAGKYYVYFGASPVVLVMFPFYWLTHLVPNGVFIQLFGCILYAYGFALLVAAANKAFGKNLQIRHLTTIAIMVLLGSLFLDLVSWRTTDWKYHIPYIYALGSAAYFVAFTLFAYASEKKRILNLAASGLFFVLIVASRATMAAILLPCIPLYLKMLIHKGEKTLPRRLLDFLPMVGILLVGAIVICAYNYVRFGKITDFGSGYQLTIADCRQFHLNKEAFAAGFLFYYLPFPTFSQSFPNIDVGVAPFKLGGIHPYNVGSVGVLSSPILWASLLAPAFLVKKDGWEKKAFYIAGIFVPYILAVVCSAYAGFCFRYASEILGAAGMIAAPGLILVASRWSEGKVPSKIFWSYVLVAGLFGGVVNIALMANSFAPLKSGDLFGFRVWIEQMFNGIVK